MISIEADFTNEDLDAMINGDLDTWFDALMEDFRTAGRKFVELVRAKTKMSPGDHSTFGNITWNLRSSIGYLIIYNGEIVEEYFPVVGGGDEGSVVGKEWAEEVGLLVRELDGVQMVIAAGMEYAVFVEDKGFDVISYASETVLPKMLLEGLGE